MKSVGLRALLAQSSLTDQDNRPLAVGRRREDIVVLNFIFTGCAASCPMQTADLVAVAKALPADALSHVQFVSVTVDPLHDTPQMLKAYARAHGADLRHWSFVTGTFDQIERLTVDLGAFDIRSARSFTTMHTTDIRVFNSAGRLMQRYAGVPVDQARLVHEITALVAANNYRE